MNRILALDVMRGITIAGMIVFNTCSGFHYAPLYHAPWIGLTLADVAFPLFMFMMGITTYLSLSKRGFEPSATALRKIIIRTLGIILVCWAFDWTGHFLWGMFGNSGTDLSFSERLWRAVNSFEYLRLSGVLVRLALCYCFCALLAVTVNHKHFPWIIIAILIGYYIILLLGNGFERSDDNILGIIDRGLLGVNHMCNDNGIDPEGVLNTLPGVAHTMIGFCVGSMMFCRSARNGDMTTLLLKLMLIGAALLLGGYMVSLICPLSKKIWSPSFVMMMCGVGALLLGLLIYMLDVKQIGRKRMTLFCVLGANPLFLYLLSEAVIWPLELIKFSTTDGQTDLWGIIFWRGLVPIFGTHLGDLVFAFFNVGFCTLLGWVMYRKRIFIKL
ncbi:MAG: acyltransferase family protein [Bacteroidaceae bacterium]